MCVYHITAFLFLLFLLLQLLLSCSIKTNLLFSSFPHSQSLHMKLVVIIIIIFSFLLIVSTSKPKENSSKEEGVLFIFMKSLNIYKPLYMYLYLLASSLNLPSCYHHLSQIRFTFTVQTQNTTLLLVSAKSCAILLLNLSKNLTGMTVMFFFLFIFYFFHSVCPLSCFYHCWLSIVHCTLLYSDFFILLTIIPLIMTHQPLFPLVLFL